MQTMQNNSPQTLEVPKVVLRQSVVKSLASTTLRSGLLLVGIVTIGASAHADTITKWNVVQDAVRNGAGPSGPADTNGLRQVPIPLGTTQTAVTYTVWDSSGAPSNSQHFVGKLVTGASIANYGQTGASQTENEYVTTAGSHSGGTNLVGVFATNNPTGTPGNPYINLRNFRVRFTGISNSSCPTLSYSNIVDGGTYTAIPTATDVLDPTLPGFGFRGIATPESPSNGISEVYMSLQQPNGQYWSGTGWSHLRVNHVANRKILDASTGQIEWSKVAIWPTSPNLPSGVYTLRTMAKINGLNAGPGTLNTITFTIGTTPTPTPTPGPDTISPNPAVVTSPSQTPGNVITNLTSITGTATDNVGGSGVASVRVNLTYEGVNGGLQAWNWVTQNWVSWPVSGTDFSKQAALSGTTWTILSGLPPANKQYGGRYTVVMNTKDVANNPESYGTGAINIYQDPAMVTTPAHNSFISSLPSISGVCDPGTLSVSIYLSRGTNYNNQTQSWDWVNQTWTSYYGPNTGKAATLNSSGTGWTVTGGLPSGASLANGYHNIDVRSTHRSGNEYNLQSSFTVSGAFAAPASSQKSSSSQKSPSGGSS